MFKVSFKEGSKKVQTFNNKATIVTLTGRITLPKWFCFLPNDIATWVTHHPTVEFDCIYALEEAVISVSGKSVCSDNDTYNHLLGERIAESRAKLRLYKFMYTLCQKLMWHYYNILYGQSFEKGAHTATLNSIPRGGLKGVVDKYGALWVKEHNHLNQLLYDA